MKYEKTGFAIQGISPAMITPFTENERVNVPVLKQLVDFLIDSKIHGLFPLGSQGEFYALNLEEKKLVIETVIEHNNGRLPVYIGAGAVSTKETKKIVEIAEKAGADVVGIITPYFITPSNDELYQHYLEVAKSTNLPVILYGNPNRTGVALTADLVVRLAEIDNIVGIKDSSGDFTLTCEYIRRITSKFSVLAGRDTLIFSTLMNGGTGAISATANVAPGLVASIYNRFIAGDQKGAMEAQRKLAPLRIAFGLGSFPAVIKEAVSLIGIPAGPSRKPVGSLNKASLLALKKVLKEMGIEIVC